MRDKMKKMRETLKARIIPNLPLTPKWIREDVRKTIDEFEFERYFKKAK